MCPDIVTCCASVSAFAEKTLLFIVLHENKALISTTFMCRSSLKNPSGTSRQVSSPSYPWLVGLWLSHGRSIRGPHISPALWCPFAFGARCQLPVPEGDMGVRWFLSRPRWKRAQPTLLCSPVSPVTAHLLPGIHFVHVLIVFILFLFPFPPPHLSPLFFFPLPLWFSLVKTLEKHANANVRCLQV